MDFKNIANIYECSPLQRGMLFHAVHQPESGLYSQQVRFSLSLELDKELYRMAWENVMDCHDALRTTFHWKGADTQLQVVQKKAALHWTEMEYELTYSEMEENLNLLAEEIRKEDFDLKNGPLMKFSLLKLKDGYMFIWTFHHLLMDGWSMPLVLKEVLDFYTSKTAGRLYQPVDSPQYSKYIAWLKEQDIEEAKDFFRKKLSDFREPSYISPDSGRNKNICQDRYSDVQISEEILNSLKLLTQSCNVTLFTVMQSIWALLINERTDQTDIVMGTVMSGRRPELMESDKIVGLFINTLPLRVQIRRNQTLLELIQQVQREQTELLQYEYTPLYEVQKQSGLSAGKQLFDNIIVFENYPFNPDLIKDGKGLSISRFTVEERSNYPVSLAVIPFEGSLTLRLHYSTEIVNEQEADGILSRLSNYIKQVVNNIHLTVDNLGPQTMREPSVDSGSQGTYPAGSFTLHERFETQVLQSGDRIAVRCERKSYTYKELNNRANQLASHLLEKGLKAGECVGLWMNRSADMVAGILGILKAGGVYVPLDNHMPKGRINYILRDCKASYVITEENNAFYSYPGITSITCPASCEPSFDKNPEVNVTGSHTAYLMYTSGSTGEPKGVTVTHEAADRHYQTFMKTFTIEETDKVLQFGTITFDPSTEQIFPALFSGAEVYIRGDELWDAGQFVNKINDCKITIGNLPTPYWNEIVQYYKINDEKLEMPSLRMLAIGGDKLSTAHAEAWNLVHTGETELYNFYGPTEIVTTCTYHKVGSELPDTPTVSIGTPFGSRKAYLLDSMDRPVPHGQTGELYIGGSVLSGGYHGKPGKTAERFLPDPFSTVPGARMYRTGDLASASQTGELSFIGRDDDQLKIRGYRIEIGEIEKALLSLRGVRQSVVKVETVSGSKSLYAYVTADQSRQTGDLRSLLGEMLPDYMVPKFIMELDEFPLLTNGKVDRKALPLPSHQGAASPSSSAPENPVQEKMAAIWGKVLGCERVSIRDNYFGLGGDSILALQIVARCQEAGIQLTTKTLFEHQTIEKISSSLQLNEKNSWIESLKGFEAEDYKPSTPISKWFFEQNFENVNHWNQSLFIKLKESLSLDKFRRALEHVVEKHSVFRTRYTQEETGWRKTEDNSPSCTFEVIDLGGDENPEFKSSRIQEAQSSLDIGNGPLMKVIYFKNQKEKKHELFFTIHHLFIDGVSWRILIEDLQTAYLDLLSGKNCSTAKEGFTVNEWGRFLKHYAGSGELEKESSYWKRMAASDFHIPKDFNNSERNTEGSVKKKTVHFSEEDTQFLLTGVNRTLDAKIQEILIVSLFLTLRKWTGEENLKIDLEGHGREELKECIQLNRTVGWFTVLYPFLACLDRKDSLLQSLSGCVRQLRAIPNNGIGYGILKYLTDEKIEDRPSEISFNYLGQLMISGGEQLFEVSDSSVGQFRDQASKRAYLIDVEGAVVEGRLYMDWLYSSHVHKDETIEMLISDFVSNVKEIMALARRFEGKQLVPKEFPRVSLDESEWDQIAGQFAPEDIYPLSPVQEGMLFHTLMNPNSGVYVEQMAFRICGEISLEAFSKAWDHVLSIHSILRADFLWEGLKKPIHVIDPEKRNRVEYEDWTGKKGRREQLLEELRNQLRMEGFIPGKDPMMKLTLIRLDESSHYFVWTYHHLLLDGWSMPMVIGQFSDAYKMLLKGSHPIEKPSLTFGDFSFWQSLQETGDSKEFWKISLGDYNQRAKLKRISRKNLSSEMKNDEIRHKLSPELSTRLRKLASRKRITLNSVIQSSWSLLLSLLGGKEQVIFGAVFSGRSAPVDHIEEMVGMFINTLPVGVKIHKGKTAASLLKEIHERQNAISQIEHTPFTSIKEMIGYKSKDPLFETCLIFANFPNVVSADGEKQLIEGVTVKDVEITEQTNFPLTLSIVPEEKISLDINYSCHRYHEEDIQLYLKLLEAALSEIESAPENEIGTIMQRMEKHLLEFKKSEGERSKERIRSKLNNRKRSIVTLQN